MFFLSKKDIFFLLKHESNKIPRNFIKFSSYALRFFSRKTDLSVGCEKSVSNKQALNLQ
ncbi:hypothetical protein l13_12680 [Neisseria weaveri ATCC 51223]|nr:hypothetical protein l13_12680 [Neisseria weaveri ATCC 51223]